MVKKKIIIACDSYKGCLSSREVNEAIASGLKEWNAEDAPPEMKNLDSDEASPEIITLEMSDGGEGMLDAFLSAMKGERVKIHAHDALMDGLRRNTESWMIRRLSRLRRPQDWL